MKRVPYGHNLGFFTSPPHECGYLADRKAMTMFLDPRINIDRRTYSWLSARGFRRSGEHVYQPRCPGCSACIPVRIRVADFNPKRIDRRTLKKNEDLTVVARDADFDQEHFELYRRYLISRHPDSKMDADSAEAYISFLIAPWSDTVFYEFRCEENLLAVAVVDHLDDALSAVYTFYDPMAQHRGLGRLAILKQIEIALEHKKSWLYLGYWIKDCAKMSYKAQYRPLEKFTRGAWRELDDDQ
ncbi:MAG: arginyltransferase [Pseudomonadota bacterium]